MNFFAHFLLARHRNSPTFHLGSLLPDLAKRAGFSLIEKQVSPFYADHPELIEGIRLHWHSDRLFHQSKLFNFASEVWKSRLASENLKGISKTFFLTHLLAEMWLDRVLLSHYPGGGVEMYESLAKASREEIAAFSKSVLGDDSGKLPFTLRQFSERKFVLAYPEGRIFSEIASGVFGHVTHQGDTSFLVPVIENSLEGINDLEDNLLLFWQSFREEINH